MMPADMLSDVLGLALVLPGSKLLPETSMYWHCF